MKCESCGEEFVQKRSTARYCSPKCRKLAFLSVPENLSVPEPVTDNLSREEMLEEESEMSEEIKIGDTFTHSSGIKVTVLEFNDKDEFRLSDEDEGFFSNAPIFSDRRLREYLYRNHGFTPNHS